MRTEKQDKALEREIADRLKTRIDPSIYAFSTVSVPGYWKVGETSREVFERLYEWRKYYKTCEQKYNRAAVVPGADGECYFRDYSVHKFLESRLGPDARLTKAQLRKMAGPGLHYSREFFSGVSGKLLDSAIDAIIADRDNPRSQYDYYTFSTKTRTRIEYKNDQDWEPRPNQQQVINAFEKARKKGKRKLLMYAVMRFGKSFTALCCAEKMKARTVLILSAKAEVESEWQENAGMPRRFAEYKFLTRNDLKDPNAISDVLNGKYPGKNKVIIFDTFQDWNTEKDKHAELRKIPLDLIIVDETHFGAWAKSFGKLLDDAENEDELFREDLQAIDTITQEHLLRSKNCVELHLSGTPYRLLLRKEFQDDEVIASVQFEEILREKQKWEKLHSEDILLKNINQETGLPYQEYDNPYFGFPTMLRFAFNPSRKALAVMERLRREGKDCSVARLFEPRATKKDAEGKYREFVYKEEVLGLLKSIDGAEKDDNLLSFLDFDKIKNGNLCNHIVCVLPLRASCDALEQLLIAHRSEMKNLCDYELINIAGFDTGFKNTRAVQERIAAAEKNHRKTISMTVGRMMTGVTVREWDTMFYFKNTSSAQEYDQAIFRLQNQFVETCKTKKGRYFKLDRKPQTLLVDFSPDRLLQIQNETSMYHNFSKGLSFGDEYMRHLEKTLEYFPIITLNAEKQKLEDVTPKNLMDLISEYARGQGVVDDANRLYVQSDLLDDPDFLRAILRESGKYISAPGITTKPAQGEGGELDIPEPEDDTPEERRQPPKDKPKDDQTDEQKDRSRKYKMFFARVLYYAYLTERHIESLDDVIEAVRGDVEPRLLHNVGLSGELEILELVRKKMDPKLHLDLDSRIREQNVLSAKMMARGADRKSRIRAADQAMDKLSRLSESEVITPSATCDKMVRLFPCRKLADYVRNGGRVLDVASKRAEFTFAMYTYLSEKGVPDAQLKTAFYAIPTSPLAYEFTYKIYKALDLETENIAEITCYDLLTLKDKKKVPEYDRICRILCQNKRFCDIRLTDTPEEGDEKVKFEVVVGNPPYQEIVGNSSTNKALGKQLFPHFMLIAFKLARYSSLLTPSKWFTGNGQDGSFPKLREYVAQNNHFKTIVNHPENDIFRDIAIGSINYYLYDNSYKGDVLFIEDQNGVRTEQRRPLFEKGMDMIFPMNIMAGYVNKVHRRKGFVSIDTITTGRNPFNVPDVNEKLIAATTSAADRAHPTKIICAYGEQRYISDSVATRNKEMVPKWKVFISKMNGGAGRLYDGKPVKIIGESYVGEPGSVCSGALIAFGPFETEHEAVQLQKYLKTKFCRFMIGLLKSSQAIYQNVYHFAPLQDFTQHSDIDWSEPIADIDRQLYKKYALSAEEIEFIENTIRPME